MSLFRRLVFHNNHGNTFFSEMLGEGGEESADLANYDKEAPVLHVLVVGFHHKKGCQVFTLYCAVAWAKKKNFGFGLPSSQGSFV